MPTHGAARHVLRSTVVAAVLAVGAAACSGDGAAVPTSSPSLSETPTPTGPVSPTPSAAPEIPTVPPQPDAMLANDEQGAIAAAQYFVVDLYEYVYSSFDLGLWQTMSDPECGFCNTVASEVEGLSEPLPPPSAATQVVSATGTTIREGERYTATIVVDQPHDADPASSSSYRFHFAIAWTDGWRMLAVDVSEAS